MLEGLKKLSKERGSQNEAKISTNVDLFKMTQVVQYYRTFTRNWIDQLYH